MQPEAFAPEPSYPEHASRAAVFEPSYAPSASLPLDPDCPPNLDDTATSEQAAIPLADIPTLLPSE